MMIPNLWGEPASWLVPWLVAIAVVNLGAMQLARIQSIVADATPLLALTTSATQARVKSRLDVPIEWLATDDLADESADGEALALLGWWQQLLDTAYAGEATHRLV